MLFSSIYAIDAQIWVLDQTRDFEKKIEFVALHLLTDDELEI